MKTVHESHVNISSGNAIGAIVADSKNQQYVIIDYFQAEQMFRLKRLAQDERVKNPDGCILDTTPLPVHRLFIGEIVFPFSDFPSIEIIREKFRKISEREFSVCPSMERIAENEEIVVYNGTSRRAFWRSIYLLHKPSGEYYKKSLNQAHPLLPID